MAMDTAKRLQEAIDGYRGAILKRSYKLDPEQRKELNAFLVDADELVMEVCLRILLEDGEIPVEAAKKRARQLLKRKVPREELKKYIEYFSVRYSAYLKYPELTHETVVARGLLPRPNDLGELLGQALPISVTAPTVPDADAPYVDKIHALAAAPGARIASNLLLNYGTTADEKNGRRIPASILGLRLDRTVTPRPGTSTLATFPTSVMDPLLLALLILRTPLERRFLWTDISRVASLHFRGNRAAVRSRPDLELFRDLTFYQNNQYCAKTPAKDLLYRAEIHAAIKQEANLLRTGNINHSSVPFFAALSRCDRTGPTGSRTTDPFPDQLQLLRHIFLALNFYPVLVERLPIHMVPGGHIPRGSEFTLPFVQAFLPWRGDHRFISTAVPWTVPKRYPFPGIQYNQPGVPGSGFMPRAKGFRFDSIGRIFREVFQIKRCRDALVFAVDRRQPDQAPLIIPPRPDTQPPKLARRYLVNDTAIEVPDTIGHHWSGVPGGPTVPIYSTQTLPGHESNLDLVAVVCVDHVPWTSTGKDRGRVKGTYCYVRNGPGNWLKYDPRDLIYSPNLRPLYFTAAPAATRVVDWRRRGTIFVYSKRNDWNNA